MTQKPNYGNGNHDPPHGRFPQAISPFNGTDHITYARRIEVYNQHLQREMQCLLERVWNGEPEHFAIATSGSDGRFEKGPQSKMEVILFHDAFFDPSGVNAAIDRFIKARPEMLWEIGELKPLGDEARPLSGYHGGMSNLYPTRVFDAELLSGNPEIFLAALEQQEKELLGPIGEECVVRMNDRRKNSMAIMRTGRKNFRGKPIVHFDIENGFSFYTDPHLDQGGSGSFKFGPLRAVQYRLATDFIRAYRNVNKSKQSMPFTLDDVPANIPERLLWIEAGKFTTRSIREISSIVDNYCYFLRAYHRSQWNYRSRQESVTEFDPKETGERMKDLLSLLEQPIIAPFIE